ncbi:MAG: hypothetical protein JXQ73_25985 [Phycisphaerae bacterium]|nr:hypothetical protein [Phycisphaerae bacterium]
MEVLYAVDDKSLRGLGRKRLFLALWLPAILAFVLAAVANCFVAEYDVKVWYYSNKDPQRKPLKTTMEHEEDRLCTFNLHLDFGLFSWIPAHWVKVREPTLRRLRFDPPPQPDFISFLMACTPLVVFIGGGYLPCRVLLSWLMRRSGRRQGLSSFGRSARTALLHLISPTGLAVWLWLPVVLPVGLPLLLPESSRWLGPAETLAMVSLVLSGTLWVVTNVMIWGRLQSLDRAGRLLPANRLTALMLAMLSLTGIALPFVIGSLL